jgi:hypothetical protein
MRNFIGKNLPKFFSGKVIGRIALWLPQPAMGNPTTLLPRASDDPAGRSPGRREVDPGRES